MHTIVNFVYSGDVGSQIHFFDDFVATIKVENSVAEVGSCVHLEL